MGGGGGGGELHQNCTKISKLRGKFSILKKSKKKTGFRIFKTWTKNSIPLVTTG